MPFQGDGSFRRTDGSRTGGNVWQQARDASVKVNAADSDTHDQDIAEALENCLTRDGQNSPSADLPMAGRKHTGVADAVQDDQYASFKQVLALATPFVGASNVAGTANAITLAPTPAATRHTVGRGYRFFVETVNTGAATLTVSGLAPVSLRRADGSAMLAGSLPVGRLVTAIYNGSHYLTDVEVGKAFDVHDDLGTELTSPADADRVPASDESSAGDPNRWLSLLTLKNFFRNSLAAVARTGSYNDLSNKPNIPTQATGFDLHNDVGTELTSLSDSDRIVVSDESTAGDPNRFSTLSTLKSFVRSGFTVAWSAVTGKPNFATVATSGSYNDLSNRPNIPTQATGFDLHNDVGTELTSLNDSDRMVVSDESSAGDPNRYATLSRLKSFVRSGFTVAWGSVTGKPSFATVATSGAYGDLSGRPSTPTTYSVDPASATSYTEIATGLNSGDDLMAFGSTTSGSAGVIGLRFGNIPTSGQDYQNRFILRRQGSTLECRRRRQDTPVHVSVLLF